MKKRPSPKKNKGMIYSVWGVLWPILLTQASRVIFDMIAASLALEPALQQVPHVWLV